MEKILLENDHSLTGNVLSCPDKGDIELSKYAGGEVCPGCGATLYDKSEKKTSDLTVCIPEGC